MYDQNKLITIQMKPDFVKKYTVVQILCVIMLQNEILKKSPVCVRKI